MTATGGKWLYITRRWIIRDWWAMQKKKTKKTIPSVPNYKSHRSFILVFQLVIFMALHWRRLLNTNYYAIVAISDQVLVNVATCKLVNFMGVLHMDFRIIWIYNRRSTSFHYVINCNRGSHNQSISHTNRRPVPIRRMCLSCTIDGCFASLIINASQVSLNCNRF